MGFGEDIKMEKSLSDTTKKFVIDTRSGSLAYNRLDMQVSQTIHMAIELYDSLDYLFVLDYYDDITLFEDERNPKTVSYYQMKSNEEYISINTAISKDWLAKLYLQLEKPEWLVKELGLITNCPLKITYNIKDKDGKKHQKKESYTSEKTSFSKFNSETIDRIKRDIATKLDKDINEIDLSKFVHMRTTLSIPKHRHIVEQEMGEFLNKKYPRITIDSVKTIFSSVLGILTSCQEYELLGDDEPYNVVREKKGMSRNDFTRIIDESMLISIPQFTEIRQVAGFSEAEKYEASFEYTNILADSQAKTESFTMIFSGVKNLFFKYSKQKTESVLQYADRLCDILYSNNCTIKLIYNRMYVRIIIVCILINEGRRSL